MRRHTGEKPYKCKVEGCNYACSASPQFTVHKRKHTGERPFKCDVDKCQYATKTRGDLTTHLRIHADDKRFVCQVAGCTYKCVRGCDFSKHNRVHTGEKPYECTHDGCLAKFKVLGELKSHLNTHQIREKSHVCDVQGCEKKFADLQAVKAHKNTHIGKKSHACAEEGCGYKCTTSSDLALHDRTHSGLKPYACDKCDYKCTTSSNLAKHKRTHDENKGYMCPYENCGYTATARQGVDLHYQSTHTSIRNFVCDHCPRRFINNQGKKKHLEMHERQASYAYACLMQDGGTQLYAVEGGVQCSIRCETLKHMDWHIQRNHTTAGIGVKLESETKLAKFFDEESIMYDRDWLNRLVFKHCQNIEGKSGSARPDFYLIAESFRLKAIVLLGNDEFCHRRYPCDLQRMWNIVQALQQTEEFQNVRILYLRFNPHGFKKGNTFYDPPLKDSHALIVKTLRNLDAAALKDGLNLIYINYDCDEEGNLDLFGQSHEEQNDFAAVLKDCVLLTM